MRNIAIAVLAVTALIMLLLRPAGGQVKAGPFVALAVILGMTLVFPFAGLLLSVPVFLVAWFDHQEVIWGWWDGIKNATLNVGGKKA